MTISKFEECGRSIMKELYLAGLDERDYSKTSDGDRRILINKQGVGVVLECNEDEQRYRMLVDNDAILPTARSIAEEAREAFGEYGINVMIVSTG